ncbi:MAG: copper chaperone PCu(A)C [Pseudomonadota bacterium]|jgi:copper(I)-binding protein
MRALLLSGFFALAAVTAANAAIEVKEATIRPPFHGATMTAGYMTLKNAGPADRLVGVSCDCADKVELHETMVHDGMAHMMATPVVSVPAGGEVKFAPGGRHLMIVGLKAPLHPGDKAKITLQFEHAGKQTETFTVSGADGEHHHP